jgi:RHS repeat-associated protein
MAAAPFARDDAAFYTSVGTDLVVTTSSSPAALLANDFDVDGGTLTASVVSSPASGSLISFGSNGTFTYRPNVSFVGVDSFSYKVNDGSSDSNIATVRVAVGTKLLAGQNLDARNVDQPDGGLYSAGNLQLGEQLTPDQTLVYRSDSLARPIIAVETQLAPGVPVPDAITAKLTFNGTAGTTYSYSTTGLVTGQSMRIALQANGTALATGMYDYTVEITTTKTGVSSVQTFAGKQAIVNRSTSEFGSNWWLNGLDRLVDSASGALLVTGKGDNLWFAKSGTTYLHADGDVSFSTLVKNGNNTFTLTSKYGDISNFSTTGLLTSLVDTNANTTTFAYADRNSDGVANELISVTDPFSRVTNLNYTSGKVTSIAHFSGQTTTLAYSSSNLASYIVTDPDAGGPLTAPTFSFAYSSAGKISSRTDAAAKTTTFGFDATDGRLRSITNPASTTWQLTPAETVGLPTATTGNVIKTPADAQAQVIDERSNTWKYRTDRFGLITESITALGFVSTLVRTADGLPLIATEPDPDATGPLAASVTKLGYNSLGDLTHMIAADGGVSVSTYSTTLHRQLSSTDPVGRTSSWAYDANGNMTSSTDAAGFVTTLAYNTRGLPTSITQPDPDGAGALAAPVTTLAYDSYGRLTTLTNADSSTQTFTYNTADQMLTNVDELGKTTSMVYDSLGRQTSITNRVAAVTQFAYDAMSRVIKTTNALGHVTDTEYNNRGWVSKVIYPDPDAAGPLARPENVQNYDAVGNLVSVGVAASYFSAPATSAYDADNRKISETDPADVNKKVFWGYDNAGRMNVEYRVSQYLTDATGKTVTDYDAVGRVIRQRVQSVVWTGSPTTYTDQQYTYNLAGELISQTDGRGYVTSYSYNSRGLVDTQTLPDADGSGSQWGLQTYYSYDNLGRLTGVNRGYGRTTSLAYNSRSWLTKITRPDPDGGGALAAPIIEYGYNVRGDRTSTTDALGKVTTTAYDDEQRDISVTYPDPDGVGPLTSPVASQTYDSLNRITSKTNVLGGLTTYTYDTFGRVLTQVAPDPDGAGPLTAGTTSFEYGVAGLSKVTDALSHITTFTRDGQGRVTDVADGLGNTISYTYDYYSNLLTQTDPDPDGAGPLTRPVTTFAYDIASRLTSKVDARAGGTLYTYDLASNLTSLTDSVNNTTNFAYDGLNRQVLNTNSLNKSTSYTFDVPGNLVRTQDRAGKIIEFDFDALDRSTAERWQSGTTTPTLTVATTQQGGLVDEQQSVGWNSTAMGMSGTYTLTHNGQTTSAIAWNATAATVQSALEALSTVGAGNVLVTVSSPDSVSRSITLSFRSGKAGTNLPQTTINTASLVPMMGSGLTSFATTTAEGGAYPEIQTLTLGNATSGTWRVAYNGEISAALATSITAAGLKSALDAFAGIDNVSVTGSSGSFTVTFGGTQSATNMSQIFGDSASATCGAMVRTITSVFDANDQLASISDPAATIGFTRDSLGRATSIGNTIAGLTPSVTLAQSFNAAGGRTELKATIGSTLDFRNTAQFDTLGRVTEIVQQGQTGGNAVTAKRVAFEYNTLDQRTKLTRYQSTGTSNLVGSTEYAYDSVNRLSSLTHKQGATTLAGYTYGYDGMSRLTSVNSTVEGLSSYTYDATSQVTVADHATGGQADESYGYDLNGNRNTSGYTTTTNNRTTAQPGFTFAYDDQGNRTSRTETATGKVTEYSWDHRNRLTEVKERNSAGGAVVKQVDYSYDAFNRLVKRAYDADGAGAGAATNQFWVYDEGINAVLQFDGSAASNLSHRYLWSDRVDELLADETVGGGADTLYALGDHLGTIRDIANFSESTSVTSITNHRTYNSFGKLTAETNAAVDLLFGYTGKQLDEATGLQHNLFRWYDSALGQWLSEDPLGFAAGDANLARYVGNEPTGKTDPSGLAPPGLPFGPPHLPRTPHPFSHLNGNNCYTGFTAYNEPVPDRRTPTRPPSTRPFTYGEREMLTAFYGPHLDLTGLVIGIGGLFPGTTYTMVPRYTPWFIPRLYLEDFSSGSPGLQHHFIHEMMHVLQSQNGNFNWIDGPFYGITGQYDDLAVYQYDRDRLGQPLWTFNFEQQADIAADYYIGDFNQDEMMRAAQTLRNFETQYPGPTFPYGHPGL